MMGGTPCAAPGASWAVPGWRCLRADLANTYWKKYYNLHANVDTEAPRFLEFERWWGGYFLMNEQEIHWIVDNLFIGNKLSRGEVKASSQQPFDLRSVKSPIIVFASMGDNITPPEQAFYWIADLYGSTEEIKANGQVIVGLVHEDVGHLGIFVSAKVARKEHSQIVKALDHIHALLPGLYRMKITEVKGKGGGVEYEAEFEEKRLEDLRLLARYDRQDEMAFEAVEEVSTLNEKAYSLLARPIIRPLINEPQAKLGRDFHPLRWQRWALSDMNPFLWPLCAVASAVKTARKPVETDNPFLTMEKAASAAIIAALDLCRVVRDLNSEALFFQIYGSMIALGIVEPKVYAEMARKVDPRELPLVRDALASIDKGGYPQAAARIGSLIGSLSGPIPLLRLQLADEFVRSDEALSRLSEEEVRRIRSEQEVIVSLEPQRALATLPALLGKPEELGRVLEVIDKVEKLVAERPELEATGEETRMLQRIKRVLGAAGFSENPTLAVHPSSA